MAAPKGHRPYNTGEDRGGRPRKWTPERIEEEAAAFDEWMSRPDSIWYEDFCLERGYLPDNLVRWARENERFCTVYKKSQAWQKSKLIRGGLLNTYNAGFTKFVMGNTCGWSDKQQIEGDAANPLSFLLQRMDGTSKDLVDDRE